MVINALKDDHQAPKEASQSGLPQILLFCLLDENAANDGVILGHV
jgi:hypothetical protein